MAGAVFGLPLLAGLSGCETATDEQITAAGEVDELLAAAGGPYPAPRNARFTYGRPETPKRAAAEYTNFYEFSASKRNWRFVDSFNAFPWTLTVDGLCSKPRTFDLGDILKQFKFEERSYRHRCVEAWAMCIPWTGFRLKDLLTAVEPQAAARFVRFETFNRPKEAPGIRQMSTLPWPYTEGLTIGEATNELALLVTGIYGVPLPKQHGAPIRLVVPWKYGFKSIKSIARITLTDEQPATFWNTLVPNEYDFSANVNPDVPHPRWSQRRERMLGSNEYYPTVKYNGYGDFVAKLYES